MPEGLKMTPEQTAHAAEIMRAGRGSHFDPRILDVFFQDFESVAAIQKEFELDGPPSTVL